MGFKERDSVQSRTQSGNGHSKSRMENLSGQPGRSLANRQPMNIQICPQCGEVMGWWRGGPFCSRCGWREGCCD
ncbi:MAG: hypothetical protein N3B10_09610 [Armatimonadetes bacterium]|nr:hypothetical protein [Armatimonadota bacterium]MCX7968725.1 hypothetical protein [Armatimonadota bacterium]MDW8142249.1 hypothetical protein [Armatimonadota bacterium]